MQSHAWYNFCRAMVVFSNANLRVELIVAGRGSGFGWQWAALVIDPEMEPEPRMELLHKAWFLTQTHRKQQSWLNKLITVQASKNVSSFSLQPCTDELCPGAILETAWFCVRVGCNDLGRQRELKKLTDVYLCVLTTLDGMQEKSQLTRREVTFVGRVTCH